MKLLIKTWKRFRLWQQAYRLGFPWIIKDYYIYAAGLELGQSRYKDWEKYIKSNAIDCKGIVAPWDCQITVLYPLRSNGELIATYRLYKTFRKANTSTSDLASGDSGRYGNFKLERIDKIPHPKPFTESDLAEAYGKV